MSSPFYCYSTRVSIWCALVYHLHNLSVALPLVVFVRVAVQSVLPV